MRRAAAAPPPTTLYVIPIWSQVLFWSSQKFTLLIKEVILKRGERYGLQFRERGGWSLYRAYIVSAAWQAPKGNITVFWDVPLDRGPTFRKDLILPSSGNKIETASFCVSPVNISQTIRCYIAEKLTTVRISNFTWNGDSKLGLNMSTKGKISHLYIDDRSRDFRLLTQYPPPSFFKRNSFAYKHKPCFVIVCTATVSVYCYFI